MSSLPEADGQLREEGEYFLAEAKKALETGMNGDAVRKIVELGSNGDASADLTEEPTDGQPDSSAAAEPPDPVEDSSSDTPADPSHVTQPTAITAREAAPQGEKLPIPPEIEGDASEMPRDLTGLSDREVRRLHAENNAFLARTTWLVAVTSSDMRNSETMRDHALRQALKRVDPVDPDTGKPKLKGILEAEAHDDGDVQKWEALMNEHEGDLEKFKALKEIYKGNVAALSREASMRSDEFTRSGGR